MDSPTLSCIFFSPTGTTRKIVEGVANGIGGQVTQIIDCTRPDLRQGKSVFSGDDLILLAVPVYYGRVPEVMVPMLRSFEGNGAKVVLMVVYGNREYDDALLELHDISIEQGFLPIAGGAFIGEHSYSMPERPMANGRPDDDDMRKARYFGTLVAKKLRTIRQSADMEKLYVPGTLPYIEPKNLYMLKKARQHIPFTPVTDEERCVQCGHCAGICPTAAIDNQSFSVIDRWQCIICFACVKGCLSNAKRMTDENFNAAIDNLQKLCLERKEAEMFL